MNFRALAIHAFVVAAALASSAVPAAAAAPIDAAAAGPGAAINAIISEYETDVRANTQKIIAATTEEEKAKYRATVPSVAPYATRVMAIIEQTQQPAETARGVSWLVTQASGFPEGQRALAMLGTSHARTAGIAEAVKALEYHPLATAEPILAAVRADNPHPAEKAAAAYALGVQYFRQFESSATPSEADAARDKAMQYFNEVVGNYGSVTIQGFPIADQASRMMFEMTNLAVGSEVPEIEGKELNGTAFKLSDYRGKHVVLMFWGGWCHACHDVLPKMNELSAEMKDKNVVVLGINTDIPEEARQAYQQYQVSFRNWSDGTTSGPITTIFNLRNFPTLYLLDPKGVIVLKNTSVDAIRDKLAELK